MVEQALAFPSASHTYDLQLEDSYARAATFGQTHGLGTPVAVARATFGYPSARRLSHAVLTEAHSVGARLLESDAKVRDDGTPYQDQAAVTKVKANEYKMIKPIKEGAWVDLPNGIPAVRFEMSGTQPIGKPEAGELKEGKYFVLGLDETRDGGHVATLGRVSTMAGIGRGKGRYVYNVDADDLRESAPEMKVKNNGGPVVKGGVANGPTGTASPKSTTGDTGRTKKVERVTSADAHGVGIKIWERLREIRGERAASVIEVAPETKIEPAAPVAVAPAVKKLGTPASVARQVTEDDLADQQYQMMQQQFATRAESLVGGVMTMDLLNGPTSEVGDDPRSLIPDTERNPLASIGASSADVEEETEDEAFTPAAESGEMKAEDLLPGDVSTETGLIASLTSRGCQNVPQVAAKLRENSPAQEWYDLTGWGLEDAKRLQWAYMSVVSGNA